MNLQDIYAPARALGGTNVTLGRLLTPLVQNVSILAGILSFAVLMFAGFQYISASGEAQKIEQAQRMITYALVGLVLSVLAYWITQILFTAFGGTGIF